MTIKKLHIFGGCLYLNVMEMSILPVAQMLWIAHSVLRMIGCLLGVLFSYHFLWGIHMSGTCCWDLHCC